MRDRWFFEGIPSGTPRRQLKRKEVAAAFARGRVATDGLKLRFLLLQAELDLVVCSGALRGKHQTFALVDDLVPPAEPISEDAALAGFEVSIPSNVTRS